MCCRLLIPAAVLGVVLYGCSGSGVNTYNTSNDQEPEVEHIALHYHELKLVTLEPARVDAGLTAMCIAAMPDEIDAVKARHGPHAYAEINIYMNERAAATFERNEPAYPVGSVIVKDKLSAVAPRGHADTSAVSESDGVGGMVKRRPGYDAEHHDWEYFYFEDPDQIETGRIASCVQCHAGAADRDYVFGDWASAASPPQD